jgi:hypothetical protein
MIHHYFSNHLQWSKFTMKRLKPFFAPTLPKQIGTALMKVNKMNLVKFTTTKNTHGIKV